LEILKMRVVSGKARGTKLFSPKDNSVRPTTDRIKESLFNVIQPIMQDSVVLDLFAGAGGIGIEFISRGSSKAYFVDSSRDSIDIITKNIKKCRFEEYSQIIHSNFERAIEEIRRNFIKVDYVFIDPPYGAYDLGDIISRIINADILSDEGMIIVECEKDDNILCTDCNYNLVKEKIYGRTKLTIITEV
jgi:16S rRNA (guanine(966)-N(2))-methyltransferase RsmD